MHIQSANGNRLEFEVITRNFGGSTASGNIRRPQPAPHVYRPYSVPQPQVYRAYFSPQPIVVSPSPGPWNSRPVLKATPVRSLLPVLRLDFSRPYGVRLTSGKTEAIYGNPAYRPIVKPQLKVKVYPVSDLLTSGNQKGKLTHNESATSIKELVSAAIHPTSWAKSGGDCQLLYLKSSQSLIVRQTDSGHRQMAELLGELRQTGNTTRRK